MSIGKSLLDVLACPECKGKVRVTSAEDAIVCDACHLAYPIKDDIPVMLIEEAVKLES